MKSYVNLREQNDLQMKTQGKYKYLKHQKLKKVKRDNGRTTNTIVNDYPPEKNDNDDDDDQ